MLKLRFLEACLVCHSNPWVYSATSIRGSSSRFTFSLLHVACSYTVCKICLHCLQIFCFIVSCPTDLVIPNGIAKFGEDGTLVTYHCDGSFKIIGSDSANCQQNGTWSSPLPKRIGTYVIFPS